MATSPERAEADEPARDAPPMPDADGPHDVPDQEVIDKTLPAKVTTRDGGDSPR